jgi:hypothetical protein
MGAKAILERYLFHNQSSLPEDPSKLREHLASVAQRDRLKVEGCELDELATLYTSAEDKNINKSTVQNEGKKRRNNKGKQKAGA